MSNFFAQPDALAFGKVGYFGFHLNFFLILTLSQSWVMDDLQTPEQLTNEKVPNHLVPHKVTSDFSPSLPRVQLVFSSLLQKLGFLLIAESVDLLREPAVAEHFAAYSDCI